MSISSPATRQELIDYCLRKLGHPVIEVNIDPIQLEDRVDEALQFYQEFHYDSTERVYLSEQVTSNIISQGYVELSDAVIGVTKVFPITNTSRFSMFDARYQILLNDLYSIQSMDMLYYSQVMTHIELINDLLVGQKPIRFQKHQNRVYIDSLNTGNIAEGSFIVFEAYRILDPDTFSDVYNDHFLKRYLTALIKQQWGQNLKKYEGVQLPGGVTLNGKIIYDEATEEIANLKEEAETTWQLPPSFFIG